MRDVAARATLLSLSRIANQGLLLLSPIILVRLLSVEDFGRYREFMVYATILHGLGGLLINSSLPSFIPAHPQHTWQFVRQAVVMVGVTSLAVVALLVGADLVFGGALVGPYLVPIALYTLFFVNFDFWQMLWLAQKKALRVMGYATGRLFLRMAVVVTVALITQDVMTIIWSLVLLELCRVSVAGYLWWRRDRAARNRPDKILWREHMAFCAPLAGANVVSVANARAGSVVIAKHSGPAALAEYTVGTYIQPIVDVLRNSLSEALLPDLVSHRAKGSGDPVAMWKRATVVYLILMIPVAVIIARHAEVIVVTLFSSEYANAVPVMQLYTLVLVRECFDFGVLLRAAGRTASFLHNNILSFMINLIGLAVFVPVLGIVGAVVALVIARIVEAWFLCWRTSLIYNQPAMRLVPWKDAGKILVAAIVAGPILFIPLEIAERFAWFSAVVTGVGYCLVFFLLLRMIRVSESAALLRAVRRLNLRRRP